ncbi:MAG: ankyrin repeat domain-containing protein [Deltaproteobacteria bacterium]|jgi:hypothetical protein|nr:ankyrin repeat domain-containing protein [Deltaproteobacteria bacterium]
MIKIIFSLLTLINLIITQHVFSQDIKNLPALSGKNCALEISAHFSSYANYDFDNFKSDINVCLKNGGDINYVGRGENKYLENETPLFALFHNRVFPDRIDIDKAFVFLLDHGAKIDYIHPEYGTLLMRLIDIRTSYNIDLIQDILIQIIVKVLESGKIDINFSLKNGQTAIFYVFHNENIYWGQLKYNLLIAKELIKYGSNQFIKDINHNYFFHDMYFSEIKIDQTEILNFIFKELNFDIDSRGNHNKTLLHFAAEHSDHKMIKYLTANGADVNSLDSDKRTALHLVGRNQIGIYPDNAILKSAKALVSYGASINALDKDGKTPLYWFKQIKCSPYEKWEHDFINELIEYIISIGGI